MPIILIDKIAQSNRSANVSTSGFFHLVDSFDTNFNVTGRQTNNTDPGASPAPASGERWIIENASSFNTTFFGVSLPTNTANNDIIEYNGSAWSLIVDVSNAKTNEGHLVYVEDENLFYFYNGTSWGTLGPEFGIANDNAVEIDDADVADNDYAKFTANGLEGRSYSEVKTDLSLGNVENTALSSWAGTSNITTVGTIANGTWAATDVAVLHGGTGASNAAGARSNLGVDAAGTDNSPSVTIAAGRDYISVGGTKGHEITLGQIDIGDDTNLDAGTNITLSGDTLNVDDAFLVNDADDTTSGTITAAGFTSTGTWTFDTSAGGTTGITSINVGAAFTDDDVTLMSAGAIKEKIESYSYSTTTGTVTSVAITGVDGIDVDSGSPITSAGTITLGLSDIANDKLANSTVTVSYTHLTLPTNREV